MAQTAAVVPLTGTALYSNATTPVSSTRKWFDPRNLSGKALVLLLGGFGLALLAGGLLVYVLHRRRHRKGVEVLSPGAAPPSPPPLSPSPATHRQSMVYGQQIPYNVSA